MNFQKTIRMHLGIARLKKTKLGIDNNTFFAYEKNKIISVVKQYSKKDFKEVKKIVRLQNYLNKKRLPVPKAKMMDCSISNNPVIIQEYMHGCHNHNLINKQLRSTVGIMIRLHAIPATAFIRSKKEEKFDYDYFFSRCFKYKHLRQMVQIYKSIDNTYIKKLKKVLIHGDFSHSNLLFNKHGTLSGLVDLDHACFAARLTDITKALIFFGFNSNDTLDESRILEFCREYNKYSALSPQELKNFYQQMKLIIIKMILESYYYTEITNDVRKSIFLNKEYSLSPKRLFKRLTHIIDLKELHNL